MLKMNDGKEEVKHIDITFSATTLTSINIESSRNYTSTEELNITFTQT